MSKLQLIKSMDLGSRVAEQEEGGLANYFVETTQWENIYNGKVDIVFGAKGTGKSAPYTLLTIKEGDLFDKGILVSPAENVRGETIFKGLIADPPPTENSFIFLWKLYCLILIAKSLREYKINSEYSNQLISSLEEIQLLPRTMSLSSLFNSAKSYFFKIINRDTKSIEHSISVNEAGMPTVSRKAEYLEDNEAKRLDKLPLGDLLHVANNALIASGLEQWILFDRLDVAFYESKELERNALRALVRCYNDFLQYSNIKLKIFVRDDIWRQISSGGFREASHITRTTTIEWDTNGLLHLIMKRFIMNDGFVRYVGIDRGTLLSDFNVQKDVMTRILPEKIDIGKNPLTFDWIISRIRDGLNIAAPREFIHMFETLKDFQIKKLERGEQEPGGDIIFDKSIFKDSLATVSKVKYTQTLISEYNEYARFIEALRGKKAEHNIVTLSTLWGNSEGEATKVADELASIGFFVKKKEKDEVTYWVPFIYRFALDLVQGKAFSDSEHIDESEEMELF